MVRLGYGTNVHPAETLAEVWRVLKTYAVPLRKAVSPKESLGIGLYLSAQAAGTLAAHRESAEDFREFLRLERLNVFTINAFPYGGFHAARVKEAVYQPDWTTPLRLAYTLDAARALGDLLEEDQTGTVSTLPLGWKASGTEPDRMERMAENLLDVARELDRFRRERGKTVVLALEPEPGCVLETTRETIAFFKQHLFRGRLEEEGLIRRHLGVCFDTCHMAVQFEDLPRSARLMASEGIRVAKAQLSSALSVQDPGRNPAGVEALKGFDEPRFLHQLRARTPEGVLGLDDLGQLNLATDAFWRASEWRCHFHVPIDRKAFPPLGTTQGDLVAAMDAFRKLPEPPDLEIETYTWGVLPEWERPKHTAGLIEGIAREIAWARERLA